MDPLSLSLLAGGASGIAGGIGAGIDAVSARRGQRRALKALSQDTERGMGMISDSEAARMAALAGLYDPLTQGYRQTYDDYLNALRGADYSRYDVAPQEMPEYDLAAETQKLLNPELAAILRGQTGQIEGSAANAGKLFSGATGRAIADNSAATIAQEYGRVQSAAQNNIAQKYARFNDIFSQALQSSQFNRAGKQMGLDALGAAANMQGGIAAEQRNQMLGTMDAASQGRLGLHGQYMAQRAGIKAQQMPSVIGGAMGALSGGVNTATNVYGNLK